MCFKHVEHEVFDPVESNETKLRINQKLREEEVEKGEGVNRIGWLWKRESKIVPTWEKVYCVLNNGCLYYFDRPRSDEKGFKKEGSGNIGDMDLAGCTAKMIIEKDQQYGILITSSEGTKTSLNADSFAAQKHWFDSIQAEVEVANDAVFRAQGIANKGMQTWFEKKAEEKRAAVTKLQKGRRMKKHYMAMGMHRCHDRVVLVDPTGQFVLWTDPRMSIGNALDGGGGDDDGVTNRIYLADILYVSHGADTIALRQFAMDPLEAGKCFFMSVKDKTYSFECNSIAERDEFVKLIESLRKHQERLEVAEEVAEKQVQNQRREKMRQSINDSALKKKQREQQESERLNRDRLEKDKENKPIAAVSATFSTVATAIKQKKGLS